MHTLIKAASILLLATLIACGQTSRRRESSPEIIDIRDTEALAGSSRPRIFVNNVEVPREEMERTELYLLGEEPLRQMYAQAIIELEQERIAASPNTVSIPWPPGAITNGKTINAAAAEERRRLVEMMLSRRQIYREQIERYPMLDALDGISLDTAWVFAGKAFKTVEVLNLIKEKK